MGSDALIVRARLLWRYNKDQAPLVYKLIAIALVLLFFALPILSEHSQSRAAEEAVRRACDSIHNIADFKEYRGALHKARAERQRFEVFGSTAYRTHYCTMIADEAGNMVKKTLASSWK